MIFYVTTSTHLPNGRRAALRQHVQGETPETAIHLALLRYRSHTGRLAHPFHGCEITAIGFIPGGDKSEFHRFLLDPDTDQLKRIGG